MKIMTVYFERRKVYRKFLTVFKRSARAVMPDVQLDIVKIEMPKNIDHKRDTAFAFIAAAKHVLKRKEPIAVADVDFLFVKPLDDVWNNKFDIAITVRKSKMKYNTGLWFYRHTSNAKLFVKKWIENTIYLMNNFCQYEEFVWSHGGIDQASLHMTIKQNKKTGIKILELPCQEWNATQSEWKIIDDKTRIIHIKSKLRLTSLKKIDIPEGQEYLKPLVKKWRSYL